MKRQNLLPGLNQRIRFEYCKVDRFSMEKNNNNNFVGRDVFIPTILLVDLKARMNYQIAKIDHIWIFATEELLKMNLHINDTISCTARPMKYEKIDRNNNVYITDVGFNYIHNVKLLSHEKNNLSLHDYLLDMIFDDNLIIPSKILEYVYRDILPEKRLDFINKI